MKKSLAIGFAAVVSLAAASQSFAAPVLSSTSTLKDQASVETTQVRWRGAGVAAGAAAGFIAGAAIASSAQPRYYGPGYGSGYYEPGYAYAPAPAYSYDPGYTYDYGYAYQPRGANFNRRGCANGNPSDLEKCF